MCDVNELRRLALAATKGKWTQANDSVYCHEASENICLYAAHTDSAYIAAASPATVLALLDRLAAAEATLVWVSQHTGDWVLADRGIEVGGLDFDHDHGSGYYWEITVGYRYGGGASGYSYDVADARAACEAAYRAAQGTHERG